MEKASPDRINNACNPKKAQEIEYYQRVIQKMPEFSPFSINAHLRLAQLYTARGEKEAAIAEYAIVAGQYAHNGALIKAIAANKMIIGLDPARGDALTRLSDLYFQRTARTAALKAHEAPPTSEKILAGTPLFSALRPIELQRIAAFLSPVNVSEGALILQEGDAGDCMYLIQTGEVGVYAMLLEKEVLGAAETEQELLHLATLKAGDFFGEQALLNNEPRNATIIAMTDARLLRFSRPDLTAVVKNYPRIGDVLTRYHRQRNANTIASLKAALQKMLAP